MSESENEQILKKSYAALSLNSYIHMKYKGKYKYKFLEN